MKNKIVIYDQTKKPVSVKFNADYTISFYLTQQNNGLYRYLNMERERMILVFKTLLPNVKDTGIYDKGQEALNKITITNDIYN